MITPNKNYPKQMNGPVISAFGNAVDEELSEAQFIENYLYRLSIRTAQATELDNIGRIIGYVRPLVSEGFNTENLFIFGDLPMIQEPSNGFSTIDSTIGGRLSRIYGGETGFMPDDLYRQLLTQIAFLKRYGITLVSVDKICSVINQNYTISWNENKDIEVKFNESIGYKNLWILTKIFYSIATSPQVLILS
jgi:hypothetical protein